MNQGAELLGWLLAEKDGDATAAAHAQRGCDGVFGLKLDKQQRPAGQISSTLGLTGIGEFLGLCNYIYTRKRLVTKSVPEPR